MIPDSSIHPILEAVSNTEQVKMKYDPRLASIRTKRLGLLLKDARIAFNKNVEECAAAMGVPPSQYETYERGDSSPSLPEVEMLAYFLKIPLEHFWGEELISQASHQGNRGFNIENLIFLRQRMIGVQLKQARLEAGLSVEKAAEEASLEVERLEAYERGEAAIPLPELERLSASLHRPVRDFHDRYGPVGVWAMEQRALQGIREMPSDLQAFVSMPINRPYLELAQRLSEMSVDKLRGVAEGLLEITL
jgi:transcriptional regulator with XRE-family HTH domain